jgi:hypothetical protein
VKVGVPSLDEIYRGLVTLKVNYRTLVDDKERTEKIRRDLTDASSEKGLQTKLGGWLKRYDAFINEKQRAGESTQDFNARKERERQQLEREWKQLRNDAVDALKTIKTMGEDLEKVLPESMPGPEWRRYKQLLNDEKEVTGFLDTDMPSDPAVIDRLREIDEQLKRIIQTIDKYAGELDAAIKKAG